MSKEELRRFFLNKRQETDSALLSLWSAQITGHILQYVADHGISSVMAYAAFRKEPETEALLRRLLKQGLCVGLPKCTGDGLMEAYELTEVEALRPGRYGILEPPAAHPLPPESFALVLVPGCCFGRDGSRLGYGGGYYDRYLPRCTGAVFGGVSYACCLTETVPFEETDVKMNLLFTEQGLINKL